jgi:copper homeostasis protein (lipoprotein)
MRKAKWLLFIFLVFSTFQCHKPTTPSSVNGDEHVITGKYWKLISIEGHTLQKDFIREPSITLRSSGNQMKGNGGCNHFTALYKIGDSNKISFSDIVSSDTTCGASETEKEFFHVLTTTNSYYVHQDTLLLKINKGYVLARLEAVYFE